MSEASIADTLAALEDVNERRLKRVEDAEQGRLLVLEDGREITAEWCRREREIVADVARFVAFMRTMEP